MHNSDNKPVDVFDNLISSVKGNILCFLHYEYAAKLKSVSTQPQFESTQLEKYAVSVTLRPAEICGK